MIPNAEDQTSGVESGFRGYPFSDLEESQSLSESEIESKYSEFISERLDADGDGIVNHAGEIPEYAREALESGWQA